jgi:hypothetical protein
MSNPYRMMLVTPPQAVKHRWQLVNLGNKGEVIWAGNSILMSYVAMARWIFCKIFKRPFRIQNVEDAFYQLDRREER